MDYIDIEAQHHSSREDSRKSRCKYYIATIFLRNASDLEEVKEHWGTRLGEVWSQQELVRGCILSLEKGDKKKVKEANRDLYKSEKHSWHEHQGYHIQMFMECIQPVRIVQLKSLEESFGFGTFFMGSIFRASWWKGVKNSNTDRARAFNYCSSGKPDGTHIQQLFCTPGWKYELVEGKGKSRHYIEVRDKIKAGASDKDLANSDDNAHLRISSSQGTRQFFRSSCEPPPAVDFDKRVGLILSAGRTGKSIMALRLAIRAGRPGPLPGVEVLNEALPDYIYQVAAGAEGTSGFSKFNYMQHKVVVWDEIKGAGSKIGRSEFFQILDKTTCQLRVLYGTTTFYCKHIFLTSQIHPRGWYQWQNDEYTKSLIGRIDDLYVMDDNFGYEKYTGRKSIEQKLKSMETELGRGEERVLYDHH